jgi:hypothetical protein
MVERAASPLPIRMADFLAPPLLSAAPTALRAPPLAPGPFPSDIDVIWPQSGPQPPPQSPLPPPNPPVAGVVPEPGVWALLIVGFFGVGGRLRAQARRRLRTT